MKTIQELAQASLAKWKNDTAQFFTTCAFCLDAIETISHTATGPKACVQCQCPKELCRNGGYDGTIGTIRDKILKTKLETPDPDFCLNRATMADIDQHLRKQVIERLRSLVGVSVVDEYKRALKEHSMVSKEDVARVVDPIQTLEEIITLLKQAMGGAEEECLKGLQHFVFQYEIRPFFAEEEISKYAVWAANHYRGDRVNKVLRGHDFQELLPVGMNPHGE